MTINCQYEDDCRAYKKYMQSFAQTGRELDPGPIQIKGNKYHCVAIDKGDKKNFKGCMHLDLMNFLHKFSNIKIV